MGSCAALIVDVVGLVQAYPLGPARSGTLMSGNRPGPGEWRCGHLTRLSNDMKPARLDVPGRPAAYVVNS